MKKLKLRYEWTEVLDLAEEHDIDFFYLLANPMEYGITGLITVLTVGAQAVDDSITREDVYSFLKKQKGTVGEELKAIFKEIMESVPQEEDTNEESEE